MAEEEIIEEVEQENLPTEIEIETKGKWQPFEAMTGQELEVGKTYHIHINGVCEFGLSENKPEAGIKTNDITYTKNDKIKLWIRTGEK